MSNFIVWSTMEHNHLILRWLCFLGTYEKYLTAIGPSRIKKAVLLFSTILQENKNFLTISCSCSSILKNFIAFKY